MTALSYRPFLLYFITNSISLLGLWIQKIGVGWLTWIKELHFGQAL